MSSKTVVLGGSGAMTSGCVYDLHQTSDFDEIVVADADEENARRLVELTDDDRVRFEPVDATELEIEQVVDSERVTVLRRFTELAAFFLDGESAGRSG